METYYKVFRKDGRSFNGDIKTVLKSGTKIKASTGRSHIDYIYFCENDVNEVLRNICDTEVSVWEVKSLSPVKKAYSLSYLPDSTYRKSKSVELVQEVFDFVEKYEVYKENIIKAKIDSEEKYKLIQAFKLSDEYKVLQKEISDLKEYHLENYENLSKKEDSEICKKILKLEVELNRYNML